MKIFKVVWRDKLVALLEGLECQNIEYLLEFGKVGDYRRLGAIISERIKEIMSETTPPQVELGDKNHETH